MPPGDLFDLTGRVALVTGASSGIGKSIALALASAGADVLLVARGADALDAACAEIERSGGRAASLPCDLADRMALKACAARASARFGAPDILVCAAGVNLRAPMLDVTEAAWDATMRVNLDAPFLLAQRLAPAMIAKSWGRIINIASLQSVRAFADSAPYGASKGALAQLTRAQITHACFALSGVRGECERDRSRLFRNRADRGRGRRFRALGGHGRTHLHRAQWGALRLVGSGAVSGEPRVRLRHRTDVVRRRRLQRRVSR